MSLLCLYVYSSQVKDKMFAEILLKDKMFAKLNVPILQGLYVYKRMPEGWGVAR